MSTQIERIGSLTTQHEVNWVDWSPDGTRLAIGTDRSLEVRTTSGAEVWRDDSEGTECCRWSPDGTLLAGIGTAFVGSLRVWSASDGQRISRVARMGDNRLAWRRDNRQLLCDDGRDVALIDPATGSVQHILRNPSGPIWAIAWSSQGNLLAVGRNEAEVSVWDGDTYGAVWTEKTERDALNSTDRVEDLAWAPSDRRLVSVGMAQPMRMWNGDTGALLWAERESSANHVCWSPDGRFVATASRHGSARILRADDATSIFKHAVPAARICSVAWSPDGTRLACARRDKTIELFDVSSLCSTDVRAYVVRQAATVGRRPRHREIDRWVPLLPGADGDCLGVVPGFAGEDQCDGHRAALIVGGRVWVAVTLDDRLRQQDLVTGRIRWEVGTDGAGGIGDIVASPDETLLATTHRNGDIGVWETATGRRLHTFENREVAMTIHWSPDGKHLAATGTYHAVTVWDVESRQLVRTLAREGLDWGLAWSPNGQYLAAGAAGRVAVWDAHTGAVAASIVSEVNYKAGIVHINGLAWSPDSSLIVVSHGSALAIVAFTGEEIVERWHAHAPSIGSVEWSADGQWIASAGSDATIKVWDARTGTLRKAFSGPRGSARVVWSPTGAFLASGHTKFAYALWDTRDLLPAETAVAVDAGSVATPMSMELRTLPRALAALHRVGIHPPASLVRDLLRIVDGRAAGGAIETLAAEAEVQALVELHWHAAAQVALVALLLTDVPFPDWAPPAELDPAALRQVLDAAFAGDAIAPDAPPPPLASLTAALRQIDDRVLTLLTILGPDAVAADPGLPVRLRSTARQLPALSVVKRQRLVARLDVTEGGTARGAGVGGDVSGVDVRGRLPALLPWQWALPDTLLQYRAIQHQLLYRAREGREPPQLRPLVLVLDVSPASDGPIAAITRPAAHLLASAMLAAGHRVVLMLAGGHDEVRLLDSPADLVPIWTTRTLAPAAPARVLPHAMSLRSLVREGPLEPAVVLLAHSWFGADDAVPSLPRLRALFVQYPNHGAATVPALAPLCERWHSVQTLPSPDLPAILGRLIQ